MLLPEFYEELFYVKEINLFESTFKIYLQKVDKYNILETQKWLKGLDKNYTIQQLKNLKTLYFRNNKLTFIPSLKLSNLPNLQQLYLSNNQLTSIPSLTLSNLSNLIELELSHNQLTSIPSLTLSNLPNLQRLYISNNQLTKKSKKYIKSLKIKYLSL